MQATEQQHDQANKLIREHSITNAEYELCLKVIYSSVSGRALEQEKHTDFQAVIEKYKIIL